MSTIDLDRYRRACAELDRLVIEHPELCQGHGRWSDHVEELDRMTTPVNERMTAYRERLRDRGYKQVAMFLSPSSIAVLDQLRARFPDLTLGDIVGVALADPGLEERLIQFTTNKE